MQVTTGDPGALFVHVGAGADTAVAASNADTDVSADGVDTVVLRAQVVVRGSAL